MATPITRDDVAAGIDRANIIVVEALPRMYYDDAHLPGALNLPHNEVDALAPELLPDKEATVVVYCANTACQNSTIAADRLTGLGYRNVFDYKDGKEDWIQAGLPTESGAAG